MDTWRFGMTGLGEDENYGTSVPGLSLIQSVRDAHPRIEFNPDGTYMRPCFPCSDINPETGKPYFVDPRASVETTPEVTPGVGGVLGVAFVLVTPNPYDGNVTPLDRFVLDPIWDYFRPSSASYPDMPPVTPPEGGSQLPVYNGGPLTPDPNLPPPVKIIVRTEPITSV
jgi:hypothetical protein